MNRDTSFPLLSIGIATYNRATFLRETLFSLLPQLEGHNGTIEVVVSDNASTDDTASVVEEFRKSLACTKYRKHPGNIGMDGNFLSLVGLAKGKFLWFLCDDDRVADGTIDNILSFLRSHPDLGAAFLNYALYNKDFSICEKERGVPFKDDFFWENGWQCLEELTDEFLRASCLVFRRDSLPTRLRENYGVGFWCTPTILAAEALSQRSGAILAKPAILYRGGNITWSKWWPLIAAVWSPMVTTQACTILGRSNKAAKNLKMKFRGHLQGLILHLSMLKDSEVQNRFSRWQVISIYADQRWFWGKPLLTTLLPGRLWRALKFLKSLSQTR